MKIILRKDLKTTDSVDRYTGFIGYNAGELVGNGGLGVEKVR